MGIKTKIILFLLIIFSIFGCGKKTSPKPRSEADDISPAVKLEKVRFLGENLLIDWLLVYPSPTEANRPKAKNHISGFRVYITTELISCRLCVKKLIRKIHLPLSGMKQTEAARAPEAQLSSSDNNYQALIPARFFKDHLLKRNLFLGVDYISKKISGSSISQTRFPPYPLKIPVPQVSVASVKNPCRATLKSSGDGGCSEERLLKLSWTPRQEGVRRAYLKNGKRAHTALPYSYRLNLYKSGKNSKEKIRRPINSAPLSGSEFFLVNFNGALYARSVDRLGNESEEILVFDGVYK